MASVDTNRPTRTGNFSFENRKKSHTESFQISAVIDRWRSLLFWQNCTSTVCALVYERDTKYT